MTVSVSMAPAARESLERLARRSYPNEACGTLLGRRRGGGSLHIDHARSARNVASEPRKHFELHPGDLVLADRLAREADLEVIGIWHTHPDQPAHLSESDRQSAWQGWIQLIASVDAGGIRELRAWRVASTKPIELPLVMLDLSPNARGTAKLPRVRARS